MTIRKINKKKVNNINVDKKKSIAEQARDELNKKYGRK